MKNFKEFLSNQGMDGVEELESFLNAIVANPAIFYDLSAKQRNDFESKIDTAFSIAAEQYFKTLNE